MRYVLAIAALALSAVLLLLGIGQRTFLAGPAEIRYSLDEAAQTSDAAYAVIDGSELGGVGGQANIVASGPQAFIATGATRDVFGWVETFDHVEISVDRAARALEPSPVISAASPDAEAPDAEGQDAESPDAEHPESENSETEAAESEAPAAIDPRGSDLWLEEVSFDGADEGSSTPLRLPVLLDDDQSVIIATDGSSSLPEDVAVVWVQDRETPWAGPMLVASGVLALVGAVLLLLAIDHDRRGLGPRRGRRGPLQGIRNSFSRKPRPDAAGPSGGAGRVDRRIALPALGLAVVLGLSGCSASYWPQFGEDPTPEATEEAPQQASAPVPVTDAQLDKILDRIVSVANEADETLSAETLAERFTGDALAQRAANYTIRGAIPDYGVIPPRITADELNYQLIQSTESWPRTMLVTVASEPGGAAESDTADPDAAESDAADPENASPSLAMVLTQESPHDNYLVSNVVALRGGLTMPSAAPAEEGTALLAEDLGSLVLPPGEVGAAFASVLQDGEGSEQFDLFDLGTDTILENYGKARAEQSAAQAEEQGKPMTFSVAARQGDEPPVALSTGVGGALVVTTVIEEQIVDSAGGRFKPEASGVVTALSGLSGQQERIVQEIAHQVLFFVPGKTDEGAKIQLLGETSELVGVRN